MGRDQLIKLASECDQNLKGEVKPSCANTEKGDEAAEYQTK